MTILDKIIQAKKLEVARSRERTSILTLEKSDFFKAKKSSLKEALLKNDASGVIAEFKRKSPSKGVINSKVRIEEVAVGYAEAGASALSILTDEEFFGGRAHDLTTVRKLTNLPLLRKDFIIDEYQVVESKSIGADVILLIAAALEPNQASKLTELAHSIGLEVLLEIHNEEELNSFLRAGADVIGVNNRNLKSFEVSLEVSNSLAECIPTGKVKISESGVHASETVDALYAIGYNGVLVGQHFMESVDPVSTCRSFIEAIQTKAGR